MEAVEEVDRVEEVVDAEVVAATLSVVVGYVVLARTAFVLSSALTSLVVFVDKPFFPLSSRGFIVWRMIDNKDGFSFSGNLCLRAFG